MKNNLICIHVVAFCSILLPLCPTSASGCAAMRGCTGCWPAWTYQSCQLQLSWSPEELVFWWGNQKQKQTADFVVPRSLITKPCRAGYILSVCASKCHCCFYLFFLIVIKLSQICPCPHTIIHIFKCFIYYVCNVCLHRLLMSTWLPMCSAQWKKWRRSTSDECPRCLFMEWLSQHQRCRRSLCTVIKLIQKLLFTQWQSLIT